MYPYKSLSDFPNCKKHPTYHGLRAPQRRHAGKDRPPCRDCTRLYKTYFCNAAERKALAEKALNMQLLRATRKSLAARGNAQWRRFRRAR